MAGRLPRRSFVVHGARAGGTRPWLILPAILAGPGPGGIALIWLAASSDTNAIAHAPAEEVADDEAIAA